MSLASVRASAREVRTAFAEAKALRERWDALEPHLKAVHQNTEVAREVLCRGFWGCLRWIFLGK